MRKQVMKLGDRIEFPFNNRMYFEQAVEAFEKSDFDQALEYIEKVYANDKGNKVNHFHTLILYSLERFEDALEIANEQKDFYYNNEKSLLLYTTILIKNRLFLEAEVLIQENIKDKTSMFSTEWENLEKELHLERELVKFKLEKQKKRTKRELIELENYSPMKQAEILGNAEELDLKDLQEVARIIFGNPHVTGMTKRAYLEILVKKEDTNTYGFPWFNQQKELAPSQLSVFDQNPIVNQVIQQLEMEAQKVPSLLEVIKIELMNDLLMLYPFIEEVITDVDYWVEAYISNFDPSNLIEKDTVELSESEETMEQWMDHLNQISQRNKY